MAVLIKTPKAESGTQYDVLDMPVAVGSVVAKGKTLLRYTRISDGRTVTTLAPFDLRVDQVLINATDRLETGHGVLEVTRLVAAKEEAAPAETESAPQSSSNGGKLKVFGIVLLLLLAAAGFYGLKVWTEVPADLVTTQTRGASDSEGQFSLQPYYVPVVGQMPR